MSLALTQADVGELLGVTDDTIGGYERAERSPGLKASLAFEIIFGKPLALLFPETRIAVADRMLRPLQRMSIRVEAEEGPAAVTRQQFIRDLGDRLAQIIPDA